MGNAEPSWDGFSDGGSIGSVTPRHRKGEWNEEH